MKGGAAGGGLSKIEPSAKINLHFHGDFHAISSAHNLLAALIDAHLFHGNDLNLDPERITWPRTMDMNDRALRRIAVSLDSKKDGGGRKTGFVITAASEIMAIVALATDVKDLRQRLDAIVIGADARRKAGACAGSPSDRRNDGAACGRNSSESRSDDRRHSRVCARRTFWKYCARNKQRAVLSRWGCGLRTTL